MNTMILMLTAMIVTILGQICTPPASMEYASHEQVNPGVTGDVIWTYDITAGDGHDISNVKLTMCAACEISDVQLCGQPTTNYDWHDGTFHLEETMLAGQTCQLQFRMTCTQYMDEIDYAIKSGQCDATGTVNGPSCVPNAVQLKRFTATTDWLTWFWNRLTS